MVVIRLSRTGAKKSPFYNVVVADQRRACNARFIEKVGFYNPNARGRETHLTLQAERVAHWINKGAQATDRVMNLIKTYNVNPEVAKKAVLPTIKELKQSQVALAEKANKAAAKKAAAEAKASEASANTDEAKPAEEA